MRDSRFDELPEGTFVSYAYDDEKGLKELFRYVPATRVHVFDPIRVGPGEFVSTPLVDAVWRAPALLCITGERQRNSRWVALEREIALRAQKPVYLFDPGHGTLKAYPRGPSLISVHDVSASDEIATSRAITTWMADNRGFMIEQFHPSQFDGMMDFRLSLEDYSGIFLAFVRSSSVRDVDIQRVRYACEDQDDDSGLPFLPKLMLACLEPPGPWIPPSWNDFVVDDGTLDLTDGGSVDPWSANRVDDLMVRLLWMQTPHF